MSNLLKPGECEVPFPVPSLERTYRIYLPLVDLATSDGETRIAPPHTPSRSLTFKAAAVAGLDRAADAFGGIPLNALGSTGDVRWRQPTLKAVQIRDPAGVIRSMSVNEGGRAISLAMKPTHVNELLNNGIALVPRADGGFMKLHLSKDAKKPLVHHVANLSTFVSDPAVVLPDGQRRTFRLSSSQMSKLATGEPVVSGEGTNATVLMRISDGLSTPAPPAQPAASTAPPPPPGDAYQGPPEPPPPPPPPPPELALLLPLDQKWLLDTYERGRLASSISLTPQEEVTVDVYSWDRRKTSREDTTSFDSEVNAESQGVDRDTRDVFGELSKTGNVGYGLNGSYTGYGVTIGGGVNNGTTFGNIARTTQQNVHEQTVKASAKVHASRQLKITESTEQGSETRVTRKLRNSNLCHPVTYHYFELAARYTVTTGYVPDETVFVLLVDNPFSRPTYDIDFVRTYESVIRRSLLDPAVASGLEAARTLWMLAHATPVICNDCLCPSDSAGTQDSAVFTQAISAIRALGTAVNALRSNAATFNWNAYFFSLVPLPPPPPPPTGTASAVPPMIPSLSVRRALFVEALDQAAPGLLLNLSNLCAPFLVGTPTPAQIVAFNNQLGGLDLKAIDAALKPEADLQAQVKKLLEARIRSAYSGMAKSTVENLLNGNLTGNPVIDGLIKSGANLVLTEGAAAGIIVNAVLDSMSLSPGFAATDDNALKALSNSVTTAIGAWTSDIKQSAAAAAEAKRDRQTLYATVFPAANVLAAQERFDALVRHLRAYSDYYANAIITDMIARGQFLVPTQLLPFVGFVALTPMAVVNGRLAFAIDLSVSPAFATARTLLQSLIDAIPTELSTDEVTLPTPGFVVEPKLSSCTACEDFVEKSRVIDLDLRRAQADQAQREAERREQLLAKTPPVLDPFTPTAPALRVELEQTPTRPEA